jgi:hypothetical protein
VERSGIGEILQGSTGSNGYTSKALTLAQTALSRKRETPKRRNAEREKTTEGTEDTEMRRTRSKEEVMSGKSRSFLSYSSVVSVLSVVVIF